MQTVFVPVLYWGREKYDYNSMVAGVFKSQASARVALLDLIKDNYFITYTDYCERFDDDDVPLMMEVEFWDHLKEMAGKSLDKLRAVCHTYGDSYFEDGWDFSIEERVVE